MATSAQTGESVQVEATTVNSQFTQVVSDLGSTKALAQIKQTEAIRQTKPLQDQLKRLQGALSHAHGDFKDDMSKAEASLLNKPPPSTRKVNQTNAILDNEMDGILGLRNAVSSTHVKIQKSRAQYYKATAELNE